MHNWVRQGGAAIGRNSGLRVAPNHSVILRELANLLHQISERESELSSLRKEYDALRKSFKDSKEEQHRTISNQQTSLGHISAQSFFEGLLAPQTKADQLGTIGPRFLLQNPINRLPCLRLFESKGHQTHFRIAGRGSPVGT